MKLILASQSMNRRRLLKQAGLKFEIIPSCYEEDMTMDMSPEDLVQELSLGKANDVARQHPDAVVVGSDTVFIVNGRVGGKPKSLEEAFKMLKQLQKTPHMYASGYAIVHKASNKVVTGVSTVTVTLRSDLTDDDLRGYIAKEREPVTTKAGAYDGANLGVALIEKIDGDYTTALGLPIGLLLKDLKQFDINPLLID